MKRIADRIDVPDDTEALLFDLDGVLLDTLVSDFAIVSATLEEVLDYRPDIDLDVIQENFALAVEEYYEAILASIDVQFDETILKAIYETYHEMRREIEPIVHKGIREILADAKKKNLKIAVVSNNSEEDIRLMMKKAGLFEYFDAFVGNDREGVKSKPAPDMPLEACRELDVDPKKAVHVEDSLVGAVAGHSAGCYVIGVATGANSYVELFDDPHVNAVYGNFTQVRALSREAKR